MELGLEVLQYAFLHKPLLIGGKAMEYYGLRRAGADVDLVIHEEDHRALLSKYPDNVKDLCGDIGVCEFGYEMWNQISRSTMNTLDWVQWKNRISWLFRLRDCYF